MVLFLLHKRSVFLNYIHGFRLLSFFCCVGMSDYARAMDKHNEKEILTQTIDPVLVKKPYGGITYHSSGRVKFEEDLGYVACYLISGYSSEYLGTYAKSKIGKYIIISPNGDYVLRKYVENQARLYDCNNNSSKFLTWKDDEWRQIEKKFFCKNNVLFVQTAKALKLINVQGEIVFERERKVTGRDVLFNVQQTRLVTQNKDKYIIIVDTETDYLKNIIFVTGDVWYGFNPRD